jgi:hypothetical protein
MMPPTTPPTIAGIFIAELSEVDEVPLVSESLMGKAQAEEETGEVMPLGQGAHAEGPASALKVLGSHAAQALLAVVRHPGAHWQLAPLEVGDLLPSLEQSMGILLVIWSEVVWEETTAYSEVALKLN